MEFCKRPLVQHEFRCKLHPLMFIYILERKKEKKMCRWSLKTMWFTLSMVKSVVIVLYNSLKNCHLTGFLLVCHFALIGMISYLPMNKNARQKNKQVWKHVFSLLITIPHTYIYKHKALRMTDSQILIHNICWLLFWMLLVQLCATRVIIYNIYSYFFLLLNVYLYLFLSFVVVPLILVE